MSCSFLKWTSSHVRFFPAVGPAVGHGGLALAFAQGQNLQPATCRVVLSFSRLLSKVSLFACVKMLVVAKIQKCGGCYELAFKAPNALQLQAGQTLPRAVLDKYKVKRRVIHEYEAASRLWSLGVAWDDALAIVRDAFQAVLEDT